VEAAREVARRFPDDVAVRGAVDSILLRSSLTNDIAEAAARVAALPAGRRAAAAAALGLSRAPVARVALGRLLRDPDAGVREAALEALALGLSDALWCEDLFGALTATNLELRLSWLPLHQFASQTEAPAARRNVLHWARVCALQTRRPETAALGCVLIECFGRRGDATNLVSLAGADNRFVRRAALHALASLDRQGARGWLERAAGDTAEEVRGGVPHLLSGGELPWFHRLSETEALPSVSTRREAQRPLVGWEQALLQRMAQDTVPELRVMASLALMSRGAPFDDTALMGDLAACRDPEQWRASVADVLESAHRRMKSPAPALLPLLEGAAISDSTRSAITRRLSGSPALAAPPGKPAFREQRETADTPALPAAAGDEPRVPPADAGTLRVVFFHEHGCVACDTTRDFLKAMKDTFPELQVEELEIHAAGNRRLNEIWCRHFHVPDRLRGRTPALFASGGWLAGDEITFDQLAELLARSLGVPLPEP
jgi:hypothetical protein